MIAVFVSDGTDGDGPTLEYDVPQHNATQRIYCLYVHGQHSCSMSASFYTSPLIGATTTLACFAHEIPHEIADYSILIRAGFSKRDAMRSQYGTAVGAFVSFLTSFCSCLVFFRSLVDMG